MIGINVMVGELHVTMIARLIQRWFDLNAAHFQYYAVAANRNEQEIQTDRVHHPQTKQNKR